jgi:hypothetical protein
MVYVGEETEVGDGVIRVTTRQVTEGPDWSLVTSEHAVSGDHAQLEISDDNLRTVGALIAVRH